MENPMDSSMASIQMLLREVAEHLAAGKRSETTAAATKLHRIAEIASTMAFTIQAARR